MLQEIQKSLHQNRLRMHSVGTASVKDSLGLWNAYHSENLHSHKSWLMAMITFCPCSKLCIHLVQTLIWQMESEYSRTCLGSPSKVDTGPEPQPRIPTSCFGASLFTAHTHFCLFPTAFPTVPGDSQLLSVFCLFCISPRTQHMPGTKVLNKYLLSEQAEMPGMSEWGV